MQTLQELISLWDSDEGKPYKGQLIDWNAYDGDGETSPSTISCLCAQGQVLHLLAGWSPSKLKNTGQRQADQETAKLLNISVAHAILLRKVNDSVNGAPAIVLTNPEKIIGDQAHIILAFWQHIDRMTDQDWDKYYAALAAAGDAWGAWAAWAAGDAWAATAAATAAARAAARAARAAGAAGDAAWAAATAAAGACFEIQGAALMRERGQPFSFLPLFGFADPSEIPLS